MVDKGELRKALIEAMVRNPDALQVISAVSSMPKEKIEAFIQGEDNLSLIELTSIDVLK